MWAAIGLGGRAGYVGCDRGSRFGGWCRCGCIPVRLKVLGGGLSRWVRLFGSCLVRRLRLVGGRALLPLMGVAGAGRRRGVGGGSGGGRGGGFWVTQGAPGDFWGLC